MKQKDIFRAGYIAATKRCLRMVQKEMGIHEKLKPWNAKDESYMLSDYYDWLALRHLDE